MESNNKRRIIKLIEILRKNTDIDHKLSLNEITDLLKYNDIDVNNRKTLYDDFKVLSDYGFDIDYSDGYYLTEAPFSVSEIKIIIDALNSLKNLDDKFLKNLCDKLYGFVSTYEENLLRKLEYHTKHSDKKFINRLEDTLQSINNNKTVIIKRTNKSDEEEIAPIFLYRNNDFYYLYYHYVQNDKIYHCRFDNIVSMKVTSNLNDITISRNKIIETIEASTDSFYSNKAQIVEFIICKDSEYLRNRLANDFTNLVFTSKGFSIKASINDALFSKLTSYQDDIKIADKTISNQYISFLNNIIIRNKG